MASALLCLVTVCLAVVCANVSAKSVIEGGKITVQDVETFSQKWMDKAPHQDYSMENFNLLDDLCKQYSGQVAKLCDHFKVLEWDGCDSRQLKYLHAARQVLDQALGFDWPADSAKQQLFAVKQFVGIADDVATYCVADIDQQIMEMKVVADNPQLYDMAAFAHVNLTGVPEPLVSVIKSPDLKSVVCAIERNRRGLTHMTDLREIVRMRIFAGVVNIRTKVNGFKTGDRMITGILEPCKQFVSKLNQIGALDLYKSIIVKEKYYPYSSTFALRKAMFVCEDFIRNADTIYKNVNSCPTIKEKLEQDMYTISVGDVVFKEKRE